MSKLLSPTVFVISMVIILLAGLAGAFGLNFLVNPQTAAQKLNILNQPVTSKPVSLTLNISSPDDNLLVFDSDLLIQGTTMPNNIVILSLTDSDLNLQADKDGNFSTTLKLKSGVNQITVTTFDDQGNSKSDSRTVYYSTEKI